MRKFCDFNFHCGLRKGSLIVDYGLITKSDASAASSIMSVNQALLSGKENVTYDGRSTPVSSMAFVDSSGGFGIYTCIEIQRYCACRKKLTCDNVM